jgi:hypothetical protein
MGLSAETNNFPGIISMDGRDGLTRGNDKPKAVSELALEDTEIYRLEEDWASERISEVQEYHKRRAASLWTAVASLVVIVAVMAGYGYSVIKQDNLQLALLPGLGRSLSAVRGRMNIYEARLQASRSNQENLAKQIQGLDATWQSRMDGIRLHSTNLVRGAYANLQAELNQRTAALNGQISQVSSSQHAQQMHIAQLEAELARTRQELASVRASYAQELADIREQQASNQREISSIDNVLSQDRVDFEIEKNQQKELVPGISLYLSSIDARTQSYQGWIWMAGAQHAVRVQGEGVQQPVAFYAKPGTQPYELVMTQVSQKEATGYLLVPSKLENQQAALDSDSKSTTSSSPASF